MSTDKQQILETVTAVSKLITLSFKPVGTKIAIRDHRLTLCDPQPEVKQSYLNLNARFGQSIERYWHGDSREDVYVLNHVIVNLIEWYIIPFKNRNPDVYRGMLDMARFLCVGLKRLQQTYGEGNVVLTLQYYINLLSAVVEDRYYPQMLYTSTISEMHSFLDDDVDGDQLQYSTIFDIDKIRNFWTVEELKSICDQFRKCFKEADQSEQNIFSGDTEIIDLLEDDNQSVGTATIESNQERRDSHNSHNVRNQRPPAMIPFPVPRNRNNALVGGHLVGISNVLETMDRRFTAMLEKSVKGSK